MTLTIAGAVPLPRSLDVVVNVSKPQAEQTTDLTTTVFVQKDFGATPFGFGADRVAFFSSYASAAADARLSAEALKAARDFFAPTKRARTLAVAQVFTAAQAGYLRTGAVGTLSAFQAVTTGSVKVTINGVSNNVAGLNFSAAANLTAVAAALQTAIRAVGGGGFAAATVVYLAASNQFQITSGTTGDASTVGFLEPTGAGTDVSGPGLLNGRQGTGTAQGGYTPGTLDTELSLIRQAARASGRFVYGWVLDAGYRDTAAQLLAGAWAQANRAAMPLVSNSPAAKDPVSTTDLGPVSVSAGQFRVVPLYHDNPAYYPDASILATMLSVNYAVKNSTLTAKFQDLPGVPFVQVSETEWEVLKSKGYNTFTLTGNTSRVFREGDTANPSWFFDDVINLDNLQEELSAAIYNVWLRNGKVPYTVQGQQLFVDAATGICERYVFNGTLSPRPVIDLTTATGERMDPAYLITPTPLAQMTVADRAARVGPPMRIDVNLAGAIHSLAIDVNAYS